MLIISYYFPPAGGSSVQRVLKFVKYLPQFGWQPYVLTAREKDYPLKDNSLIQDIPKTLNIYRTPAPDLYQLYERLGKKSADSAVDISSLSIKEGAEKNLLKRVALFIRAAFFIPDARVGWLPFALIKGLQIIHKEKVQFIFVSAPPFTTTLIGGLLSKLSGLPWVSDYRDPWTQAYFYFTRPIFSARLESFLEKKLLHHANQFVAINQPLLELVSQKYDDNLQKKSIIISNGFDPEDFEGIKPVKNSQFTVTYTGTINTKMEPTTFLKAVHMLAKENRDFSRQIQIQLIGRVGDDIKKQILSLGLNQQIHFIDHLPHDECLAYTLGADILLLLIPDDETSPLMMTGKLFEYLKSGNPILCLSEDSMAAKIIQDTQTGWTVSPKNTEQIQAILKDTFAKWQKGKNLLKKSVRQNLIDQFDRKMGAKKLADVFHAVLKSD